ncbi:MAG: lipopolysaccharide biosynthesis protein [Acidimicrobiales bacterium]
MTGAATPDPGDAAAVDAIAGDEVEAGASQAVHGRSDRAEAARGGRWGLVSGMFEQVGSIVATIVLARLLSPQDFGVVAAATLLLNLLHMAGNIGLGASLVRRDSIEEPVSSTTFWLASGIGVALTSLLIVLSPLLARAMGQPSITAYVIALSPLLAINMVSNVSEARLLRELRFPWVYTADILNIVVYVSLTLLLAWAGLGAWSMVIGRVAGELLATILRMVAARWLPRWTFDLASIKGDLRYNAGFFGNQFLNYFVKNVDYWMVSFTLGATALGLYYIAFVLPNILRQRLTWLAGEILFPLMARAKDDLVEVRAIYQESVELLNFIAIPLLGGVALTATQIIALAFDEKWMAAVGPLRWLTIAALAEITGQCGMVMFLALGKPSVNIRIQTIRLVASVAFLFVVARTTDGITPVAVAIAAATLLSTIITQLAVRTEIGVGFSPVLRLNRGPLAGLAAMAAVVIPLQGQVDGLAMILQAIVLALAGAAAYLTVLLLVDRTNALRLFGRLKRVVRG